eukprot:UN04470
MQTQPFAEDLKTRKDYMKHVYAKYAAGNVKAMNETLSSVQPPLMDEKTWRDAMKKIKRTYIFERQFFRTQKIAVNFLKRA